MKHTYFTKPGIYRMFNVITDHSYIGSSKNLSMRISSHGTRMNKGYKDNIRIRKDLELYGKESFKFEVLEYCEDSIIKDREQYYFEVYKPYYNPWSNAYNAKNRSYTEEQLEKLRTKKPLDDESRKLISEKKKIYWANKKSDPNYKEFIKHLDRTGSKHSEETKIKMSIKRIGRPKPESFKEKMRTIRSGTKWDYINKTWIKI